MQHEKLDDQEDPRGAWRLVDLDHAGWAWEWLRRNPRYRADVALIEPSAPRSHGVITLDRTAADRARLWGLHFRRGPGHRASTARLLWRGDRDPTVLTARAEHVAPDDPDAILLETLPGWATLVDAGPRQHLVLADGVRRLRVDIEGSLTDGPVRLHYELAGIHGVETKLHTLKRLLAALRLGRFARGLELVPPRADRLGMMLRAHDLAAAGASHRAIAVELFGAERVSNEWRTSSDSLRLRVQRLCRDAAKMVDGGYFALLADSGG